MILIMILNENLNIKINIAHQEANVEARPRRTGCDTVTLHWQALYIEAKQVC